MKTGLSSVFAAGALVALASQGAAQTSTLLKTFNVTNGANPEGGLVSDGQTLYGTAYSGGASNRGTIFKINTDGTGFVELHSFYFGGYNPSGTLILSDGILYGTARAGGGDGRGVIFRIATNGAGYTVLKDCNLSDGSEPHGGLVLQSNILFGTTFYGGTTGGGGVVFRVNTDGTDYTVLKRLNPTTDGSRPMTSLVCADNVLYGTTVLGGLANKGTVFKVNTDGSDFTVLHHFDGPSGDNPEGAMVLNGDTLYGTTYDGGAYGFFGTIFKMNTNGTGFTVLKSFDSINDGAFPIGGLILAGGRLFGTTIRTVFKINLDGSSFASLKPFGDDGNTPTDSVLQDSILYTSLRNGGNTGYGGVWKCDLRTPLNIQRVADQAILTWTNAAFGLQSAPESTGTYTNVPNATNPFTNQITGAGQLFRLQMN
jgi:uncharacterized repeat protein (TIGR03803 family)